MPSTRSAAGRSSRPPDEGLARGADEYRPPQHREFAEAIEQLQVVLEALAEADSRVDENPVGVDPGGRGAADPRGQLRDHLAEQVVVVRGLLHGAGRPLHVHDDERRPGAGDDVAETRVEAQRRDVVDDRRPGCKGRLRHGGLRGVDAHRHAGARGQLPDDGHHAAQLLLLGDRFGAGARRLAADVEDVGPLARETQAVLDRRRRVEERPAVREGVRGDVDDPHDRGALPEFEDVRTEAQRKTAPTRGHRRLVISRSVPPKTARAAAVARARADSITPAAAPPAAAPRATARPGRPRGDFRR